MKTLCCTLLLFLLMPMAKAQSAYLHMSKRDFKYEFLDAINAQRAKGCTCGTKYMRPAPPLTWSDVLAGAAREHATDMYRNQYFSHQSQDGRDLQTRLFNVGYTYKGFARYAIAENIAMGQQSINEVLQGWFKSPGHCLNLMNPEYTEIGIAENNTYWVQDFGGRVSFASR